MKEHRHQEREPQLDRDLAEYTDALLEGREPEGEVEVPPEMVRAVQMLAETLPQEPPSSALQQRVKRRVRDEWGEQREPWWSAITGALRSLSRRPAWVAIATLVVVGILVTLMVPGAVEVTGTAVDAPIAWTWFALLAVILVAAGVVIWWIRKRR
ncbi:MAG: hypothetical protein ACLFU8_16960 [Anaerolineales bacterium]